MVNANTQPEPNGSAPLTELTQGSDLFVPLTALVDARSVSSPSDLPNLTPACPKCRFAPMCHSDDDYGYCSCLRCGYRLYDVSAADSPSKADYTQSHHVDPQIWSCAFRLEGDRSRFNFPHSCIWLRCERRGQPPIPYCIRHQREYTSEWGVPPPKWSDMNLGRPFAAEIAYLWDGEYGLIQRVRATTIPIPKRERTLLLHRFRASVSKFLWMGEALRDAEPYPVRFKTR